MSTRNNSLTASMFAQHIMTRSLPTIEGSFRSQTLRENKKNLLINVLYLFSISLVIEPEHSINIPSYIMRGAGKQTHVEYEIRIFLSDDRWLLLRRYSRFRELHLNMKALYGEKVNYPTFLILFDGSKVLFNRSQKFRFPIDNCLHQTAKMSPKIAVDNWKLIFDDYSSFAQEFQQVQYSKAKAVKA